MKVRTICLALFACACSDPVISSDPIRNITNADAAIFDDAAEDATPSEDAAAIAQDATTFADAAQPDALIDAGTTRPDATAAEDATPSDSGVMVGNCPSGSGSGTTPSANMSFFASSIGNGAAGGNYGGLNGADQRCACLAQQVGRGNRTWRAYLSTSSANARDRIGSGPWYNYNGDLIAADIDALHSNPPVQALLISERGDAVPRMEHDILTGSTSDGRVNGPLTCADWTTNDSGFYGYVGHSDWVTSGGAAPPSWNSAHETSCDQAGLNSRLGSGRIYCFAAD